jgi:hypothetical protein
VLRGFHEVVAGVTFGPYDTILGAGGLLLIASGLASIAPLRGAAQRPPDVPDGAPAP